MTNLHEPVYLRFRGRTRRLPLLAIATALRRDADGAVASLEILINGPPETRDPVVATTIAPPAPVSATRHGEGDIGGGVQPQEQTQLSMSCEQEHEQGVGGAGEGVQRANLVDALAAQLGSDANRVALRKLAEAHPAPVLYEALRRTMRIPPERIRSSRSAIFTGVVRKLAAETAGPPTP
jgi:hypothetical protein